MDPNIPYYPTPRYKEKNLAAEKMPMSSLTALGDAAQNAVRRGWLTPEQAQAMLANSLTEGRPGDYGVNWIDLPQNSWLNRDAKKLGLVPKGYKHKGNDTYMPYGVEVPTGKKSPAAIMESTPEEKMYNAQLAALALGEKRRILRDDTDIPALIAKWNGKGPMSENHARRFLTMQEQLQQPENNQMRDLWSRLSVEQP